MSFAHAEAAGDDLGMLYGSAHPRESTGDRCRDRDFGLTVAAPLPATPWNPLARRAFRCLGGGA